MRYTDAPLRREELLRRITDAGYVSSQHVAAAMGVSEMTIRRDLRRLDADGLVRRVAGGAALPGGVGAEPFEERTRHDAAEKRAIARAAVAVVAPASGLLLDAGTTVLEAVAHLRPGVLVASHSLPVLDACAAREDLAVMGLGGTYQPDTRAFAGPATRAALEGLAVDAALVSAVALGPRGLYCANPLDAETKGLLMAAARRVVLLVDHTKVTSTAPLRFAGLSEVDVVVTDAGIDAAGLAMLRDAVDEVVVA